MTSGSRPDVNKIDNVSFLKSKSIRGASVCGFHLLSTEKFERILLMKKKNDQEEENLFHKNVLEFSNPLFCGRKKMGA